MTADRDKSERVASAGEYLRNEAHYAVQDIRQKLFEEAWFGRAVTPAPVVEVQAPEPNSANEPERRPKFEDVWGPSPRDVSDRNREKERDGPDIER
jgi:hypothetical protein